MSLTEILSYQQNFIYDQLQKDFTLLGDLEDELRTESDPKRKTKLSSDIVEIKAKIAARQTELEGLQNKESSHSSSPPRRESETETATESLIESESAQRKTVAPGGNQKTGREQIGQAIESLNRVVEQNSSKKESTEMEAIDDFHLLRIQLLISAKLASTIPTSMLGRHEINRLYLSREKLCPIWLELTSLLRLLIDDHTGYVPGWYWFHNFDSTATEMFVSHLAFSDQESSVRQQSFEMLAATRIPMSEDEKDIISRTITLDSSAEVRRAALSYLGRIGGQEHLPIVHSAFADREQAVLYQARVSKYLILTRTECERAFSELLGESGLDKQDLRMILKELDETKQEITLATLTKSLAHSESAIRLFGVKELIARSELSIDDAVKLKTDSDDSVQVAVFQFLIKKGSDIEPDEIAYKVSGSYLHLGRNSIFNSLSTSDEWSEILPAVYRQYDFDRLLKMSDWTEYYGFEAYRALAIEHFAEFGEKLRADLRDNFAADAEKYYEQELEKCRERSKQPETLFWGGMLYRDLGGSPTKNTREPEESAKDSVEGHKKYYLTAALAGLLKNGSAVDVEFGRRFLSHTEKDVRIEALKIIRKWGDESDVPELIKIVQNSDEFVQELAAETALTVTENRQEVTRQLLESRHEVIISIIISDLILRDGDRQKAGEFLKNYLYSDNENIRTRAMVYFALKYDAEKLTALLKEYTSETVYYYDVVCCFDRILYAPANLRSYYNKTFKSIFFGLLDDL